MRYLAILLSVLMLSACGAAETVRIGDGREAQTAVDAAGNVYVVYGSTGKDAIFCAASSDGGKTFGAPVKVAAVSNMALGMRRGPRVAAGGNTVAVTAVYGAQGGGKDGEIGCWTSKDQGKTWQQSTPAINKVPAAAREGMHAMAAGPNDRMFCVWLDLRNVLKGKPGTELWGAGSSDGGLTWSVDALVYKSPDGSICQCCNPSVAFDAKGNINVSFRNEIGGARDIYYTRSADGGKTFSPAVKLGGGSWPIKMCPMDGGAIAGTADGKAFTIWRRNKNIFSAIPGQPEKDLGPGEQPWTATGPDGAYSVWLKTRPGDLMLMTPVGLPLKLASGATDPSIACSIDGKGPVVAAWDSNDVVSATLVAPRK